MQHKEMEGGGGGENMRGGVCFAHVKGGESGQQWPSQGAVIQARASCRLGFSPYLNNMHVYTHINTELKELL